MELTQAHQHGTYLKYHILVTIAICVAERVGAVCGGRATEYYRLLLWTAQVLLDFTPLESIMVGRDEGSNVTLTLVNGVTVIVGGADSVVMMSRNIA